MCEFLALAPLVLANFAAAQSLPLRRFDIADGLAHTRVNHVFQDSRGYLWCGTWEGLSRFDGAHFENYGAREGLDIALINVVAEDARGRIWIGTQGTGIARLEDRTSRPHFEVRRLAESSLVDNVNALTFDAHGRIWCGTEHGVYRGEPREDGEFTFSVVLPDVRTEFPQTIATDALDRTWIVDEHELTLVDRDRVVKFALPEGEAQFSVAIVRGDRGRMLVARDREFFEFALAEDGEHGEFTRRPLDLAPGQKIRAVLRDSKDRTWFGTTNGLIAVDASGVRRYDTARGLPDNSIRTLCEDREGDLWVGTWAAGLLEIAREGVVSWRASPDFASPNVAYMLQARDGRIYAATDRDGVFEIGDDGVRSVEGSRDPEFHEASRRLLQDSKGDWWIGTGSSLYHATGPELDPRRAERIDAAHGVPASGIFSDLFEGRDGRIWFGGFESSLHVWDPRVSSEPNFRTIANDDVLRLGSPRVMFEDRDGQTWLASFNEFGRLDGEHVRIEVVRDGLPDTRVRCFHQDAHGRLWIGTRFRGVYYTDDPKSDAPHFVDLSMRDGLSSDAVWTIEEDAAGRLYFGTGRGVDRFDPTTKSVRHFDTAGGLAGTLVNHLLRDRDGKVWVGTSSGVSRIDPKAELESREPPSVFLAHVEIAGEESSLAGRDVREFDLGELANDKNDLSIEYRGLCLAPARRIDFESRLDGVDSEWKMIGGEMRIRYSGLPSGSYRFRVRAIDAETRRTSPEATLAFTVLSPIWLRPWFLALIVAATGGVAFAWHRTRLRQALALERIRAQIALDLHDDLGANLSQIAILSEVARRDATPESNPKLAQAAELARSMRESLGDIVWAVDPRKDSARDLARRMREVGVAMTESDGPLFELVAPSDDELARLELSPDVRRHLFLIFKESLHNVVKHARATRVDVRLSSSGGRLELVVQDDGRGFDTSGSSSGHGLHSLRTRAGALGAKLDLESHPGHGTRVAVALDLKSRGSAPA